MKHMTRQKTLRLCGLIVFIILVKICCIDKFYCPAQTIDKSTDTTTVVYTYPHAPIITLQSPPEKPAIYENELLKKTNEIFEGTLRNCLGPKCFDMVAAGTDRIGLLAPPNTGAENIINAIVMAGVPLVTNKYGIISTTNVPAYGYGKNHGWSRIIRLVRRPFPHALNILLPTGQLTSTIGAMLFEAQV
jgi:hypothetical protein